MNEVPQIPITSPNLTPLSEINSSYPYVIIGGGITGIGIFRDLSLHQESCLIVEQKTFMSQTSSKSSKMLHGGLRYLKNLEFGLVQEALRERNLWERLTPQYCQRQNFFFPVYQKSAYAAWEIKLGIWLYSKLAREKSFPFLKKHELLAQCPQLNSQGLKGAGVYQDIIVDDYGLGLACLQAALNVPKAHALEGHELTRVEFLSDSSFQLTFQNQQGQKLQVKAQELIFATGPFTDQLFQKLSFDFWQPRLAPTAGAHLWLPFKKLPLKNPLVLPAQDDRVFFVIPHGQEKILVGTTERTIHGNFFDLKAQASEIEYLLKNLNLYFPTQNFSLRDIQTSYAGIRPLVLEGKKSSSKISREHKIFHPQPHLHVILGGKYTTFRSMASDLIQDVFTRQGKRYNPDLSTDYLPKR